MTGGQELRRIGDFEALCRYLEDGLGWPLGEHDFDTLTFEYDPDELGLQGEYADAIESIHQMRPAVDGQPWGIFFVRFKKKKLPIGVLRRILSQLALKKRASANKADRAAWKVDDLLFVSAFGEEAGKNREIAFAHFHQHSSDLPTLRVLGWDANDTPLKLEYLQGLLAKSLRWPPDTSDVEEWRTKWRSPFRHRPGHVIRKANELAEELARLAKVIRDRAQEVMKAESARGPITKLHDAFKKALIHDLTPESFADTYAQTITYGLLTAAISRTEMSEGRHGTALIASDLADMVPVTNPFLKEMLQSFLEAGGRKGGIDFDELGVQDVVELLRGEDTDLPAILRDFGNKTRGEDPVIHFYEHFLGAYNKKLKVQRGVFYTPQPVVSYIVRSVHELLQTEFGLADGLADTATWGEMLEKHREMKLPLLTDEPGEKRTISPDEPFVQILDPATGTATFLVEVVDVIYRTLAAKWRQQRLSDAQQREEWNNYVPKHLLPRLHAFELMMAPYAIAHMKIGLKLAETGYRFGTEERARIYLTNALESWMKQLPLIGFDALAHEAAAVNEIKRHKRFTVVIGNPPYSLVSANMEPPHRALIERYKFIAGERIRERGALQLEKILNDDYVKFIAKSQDILAMAGAGIMGLITNHAYLDNPTMRGLRHSFLDSFTKNYFHDLGGSAKKIGGNVDENVFDIQQGVAICINIKSPVVGRLVNRSDRLAGLRVEKYKVLGESSVQDIVWSELSPSAPYLLFIPTDYGLRSEYDKFVELSEMFPLHSIGCFTSKDHFVISRDRQRLIDNAKAFRDSRLSDNDLCKSLEINPKSAWDVSRSREQIRRLSDSDIANRVLRFTHRPFDRKYIFFHRSLVWSSAYPVNRNLMKSGNMALVVSRQLATPPWNHVFCSNAIVEMFLMSNKTKEGNHVFPLHILPDEESEQLSFDGENSRPNFSDGFLQRLASILNLPQSKPHNLPRGLSPEDVFHYIYAVFHSREYRRRYTEFLKIDFPRVPLTKKLELFRTLVRLGGEISALHLLEWPNDNWITQFVGGRHPEVKEISWSDNTVWVDKAQTIGFQGVSQEVWNFHIGGYQVCRKWLKDRKGCTLSKDDIAHYHNIVVALSETIRLMVEIDAVIEQHGGWPGAFSGTDALASNDDSAPPAAPPFAKGPLGKKAAAPVDEGLYSSSRVQSSPAATGTERPQQQEVKDDRDRNDLWAKIRQLFAGTQSYERDAAIKSLANSLGYQRVSANVVEELDNALRTAVRRGILTNEVGSLQLQYRTIEQHATADRDGLKAQFLASIGRAWIEREDAVIAFARWLGFRRIGPKIEEVAASLINGLLREGRLEKDQDQLRRAG